MSSPGRQVVFMSRNPLAKKTERNKFRVYDA